MLRTLNLFILTLLKRLIHMFQMKREFLKFQIFKIGKAKVCSFLLDIASDNLV